MPEVTVSAPGKPIKRLSNERFSWKMMTMCLMVEEAVGGGGVGGGVGGVAALPPPQPPRRAAENRSVAQSNRDIGGASGARAISDSRPQGIGMIPSRICSRSVQQFQD